MCEGDAIVLRAIIHRRLRPDDADWKGNEKRGSPHRFELA